MKKTVLVIEDDYFIRTLLNFLLQDEYEVVTVENGMRGLVWMDKGNLPDIILSDIDMPQLNGFDLLKHLKQSGYYYDIPVVMLTGYEDENIVTRCLQAGASGCLTKPFNPPDLLSTLENLLSNQEQAEVAPNYAEAL
jgi:two-component system chemotaxis response regulator CheY